jgi:hypothetical protein
LRACARGEAGPQLLLLFNELAQPLTDGRPLRLQFTVMTKPPAPDFTLRSVVNHAEQVNRIRRIVQRVWIALQSNHFDFTPLSINCPTCPCRAACKAWQGWIRHLK